MIIKKIEKLLISGLEVVKLQKRLFVLEYQLARYSLFPFLTILLLTIIIAASLWLLIIIIIGAIIYQLSNNLGFALIGAFIVNAIFFSCACYYLNSFLKKLKFIRTRQYLHDFYHNKDKDNVD